MALLSSEGTAAPATENARYLLVSENADLEGYDRGVRHQTRQLAHLYGALIDSAETLSRNDLRPFFDGIESPDPRKRGRYGMFDGFYSDVARDQLPNLPGVESTDDGFRFVGIDADAVDVETRPLADLRDDPETDARIHLAERHGPGSDETETLLAAFAFVRERGETTTSELEADRRFRNLSTDALASVPHITRERENVTAEDIRLSDLETLADLEAARERVESGPVERWSFTGK